MVPKKKCQAGTTATISEGQWCFKFDMTKNGERQAKELKRKEVHNTGGKRGGKISKKKKTEPDRKSGGIGSVLSPKKGGRMGED